MLISDKYKFLLDHSNWTSFLLGRTTPLIQVASSDSRLCPLFQISYVIPFHCPGLGVGKSDLYMEQWSTPSSLNGAPGMLVPTEEAWAECWHISCGGPGHQHHYKVWLNRDPSRSSQSRSSALNTQIKERVTSWAKLVLFAAFGRNKQVI